jgi:hypothetical protein
VALTGPRSRLDRLTSLANLPVGGRHSPTTGGPRQTQRRLSDAEVVALAAAYRAGTDLNQLAKTFGVHRHTAAAHLRRLAIPLRRQGIDDEDVSEVVRLYVQDGWSLVRLGEKFKCDASTVRQVLMRNGVVLRAPWERP